MWHQKLLEEQACELGLELTPLSVTNACDVSQKIGCCGGVVVRLVTESSADTTICLRDNSGTCFCALHGDITSTYPEAVTSGALLLFRDITLLVTCANTPPLLIACLPNLAGLMLPEEQTNCATTIQPTEHICNQTYSETNHTKELLTNSREEICSIPCAPEKLTENNNRESNNARCESTEKAQCIINYHKESENIVGNDGNKDGYYNENLNNDSNKNIFNAIVVNDYDSNNEFMTENVTLRSNAKSDEQKVVNAFNNNESVNCDTGKYSNSCSNVDNKYDDECLEFADEFEREESCQIYGLYNNK